MTAHVLAQSDVGVVTLLERGQDPRRSSLAVPHSAQEMERYYHKSGLNFVPGSPSLVVAEANVLGGGSQINSGIYRSLPEAVRQNWQRDYSLNSFAQNELLPFQQQTEELLHLASQTQDDFALRMATTAQSLGLQQVTPLSWWSDLKRTTMAETLLSEAEVKGANILAESKVIKLAKEKNEWIVFVEKQGRIETYRARNLVVAAGAFATAALVSPFVARRRLSIFFHPQMKIIARFAQSFAYRHIPTLQLQSTNGTTFGFSSSRKNHLLALAAHSPELQRMLLREHTYNLSFYASPMVESSIQLWPKWRGSWLCWSKRDLELLRRSTEELAQLLTLVGAQAQYRIPRPTAVHLMGGLGMGEADACLADSFGRIKGQVGLYAAGVSLFNGSVGVNPQGVTMMISMRNAREWLR